MGKCKAIIQVPIYKKAVLLYCGSESGLFKTVRRDLGKDVEEEVRDGIGGEEQYEGITLMTSTNDVIVHLPEKPKNNKGISTLTHELFYASSLILEGAGIRHTKDTEEAYAYLLEYLLAEALDSISLPNCKEKQDC